MSSACEPSVAVVIPVHNAEATIAEQLQALSAQEAAFSWEIVLVLNRCTDRTLDAVEAWLSGQVPKTTVVIADERAGASYARNAGVSRTEADVLVFCDADDVVAPGWLSQMVAALDHADVVGGRLTPLPSSPPEVLEMFPVYRSQQSFGLPAHGPLRYPMTASMCCRREAFDAAGGFDERFVHGCDDVVFSLRVQQAGYRLGFAESASCGYRIRGTIREAAQQRCSYAAGNVLYSEVVAPFLRRSEVFEWLMLVILGLRALASWPPSHANRYWVHCKAQRARLRALLKFRAVRCKETSGGPEASPNFIADLGRAFPWLCRVWFIDRTVRRWMDSQPLVDVTVSLTVPVIGGLGMVAPFDSVMTRSQDQKWSGALSFIDQFARDGDAVIDVGGGYGLFSVAAARKVGPRGSVLAIEPTRIRASALRANLERHAFEMLTASGSALVVEDLNLPAINAVRDALNLRLVDPGASRPTFICLNDPDNVRRWGEGLVEFLRKEQWAAIIVPHWILADRALSTGLICVLRDATPNAIIWTASRNCDAGSSGAPRIEKVGNWSSATSMLEAGLTRDLFIISPLVAELQSRSTDVKNKS
jgi:GT2 family glycosyltransferase